MEMDLIEAAPEEPILRFCNNIKLPEGELSTICIGPNGIFAIAEAGIDPERLYQGLRTVLGTTRIRLYVTGSGLFEPLRGRVGQALDEDALAENISQWVNSGAPGWSETQISKLEQCLTFVNGSCRGKHTDSDGNVYIQRNGKLHLAAPRSSETMFYLTLFGGILGLHRFYSGNFFTGLLYLCTGGLFTLGWVMDMISLFFGAQKDNKKRYYEPLRSPLKKLFLLPLGLILTVGLLFLQFQTILSVLHVFNSMLEQQMQHASPTTALRIETGLQQFIQQITSELNALTR